MELSKNALSDLRDTLQDTFDGYWNDISIDFDEIKMIISPVPYHQHTLGYRQFTHQYRW
jgi:hypothetical protein